MGQGFAGFMGGGAPNPALYTPEMIQRARWQALSQLGAGIMGAGAGTSAQRRAALGQAFGGAGEAYQGALKSGLAEKEYLQKQQEEAEADKWRQMAQTNPQYLKSLGYTDDQIQLMKGMPGGMFEDVVKSRFGDMFKEGEQTSWQQVEMLDENGKPAVYLFDPKNPNTPPRKLGEKQAKAGEGEAAQSAEQFKQEEQLYDNYTKAAEPYVQGRQMHQRLLAAASDDTGAGDVAMMFSFMKMLDPGSTVRESEQSISQNIGGYPAYVQNWWKSGTEGRILSPTARAEMAQQGNLQYEEQYSSYQELRQQARQRAQQYGLNPDRVAPDLTAGVPPPGVTREEWNAMTPDEKKTFAS